MTNHEMTIRYTWKPAYHLPLESDWSLETKFCVLNALSKSRFKVKGLKRVCLDSEWKHGLNRNPTRRNVFMEKELKICPVCFYRYGYHSVLHQSRVSTTCFYHKNSRLRKIRNADIYIAENYAKYTVKVIQSRTFGNRLEKCILNLREFCFKSTLNAESLYYSIMIGR